MFIPEAPFGFSDSHLQGDLHHPFLQQATIQQAFSQQGLHPANPLQHGNFMIYTDAAQAKTRKRKSPASSEALKVRMMIPNRPEKLTQEKAGAFL